MILVTGANGMVGHAIQEVFNDLILTDKDTLDVSISEQVNIFARYKPNLIIHLAAETDLEKCEREPGQAYFTNSIGTYNMVKLAEKLDVPIVYISTAGVFDGTKLGAYTVDDVPNPINHYGRSKWIGELFVKDYQKHYIIRASWMMGGGPEVDKKFVNKLYKKLKNGEKVIQVCDDCVGSPTYTKDLVGNILYFLEHDYEYGIYHCANKGQATRWDVAREIVKILGSKTKIIAVQSKMVKKEFSCLRSKNEVLELSWMKFNRPWQDALKEYLKEYAISKP